MYVKMLEAISEMITLDDCDDAQESIARIKCAKLMLDKIIEGMKDKPELPNYIAIHGDPVNNAKVSLPKEQLKPERHDIPHPVEPSIEVDDTRKIVKVHNATPETIIELDGKKYTPTQVIGMSFTKGKIL